LSKTKPQKSRLVRQIRNPVGVDLSTVANALCLMLGALPVELGALFRELLTLDRGIAELARMLVGRLAQLFKLLAMELYK
jgi:hypothetical protein